MITNFVKVIPPNTKHNVKIGTILSPNCLETYQSDLKKIKIKRDKRNWFKFTLFDLGTYKYFKEMSFPNFYAVIDLLDENKKIIKKEFKKTDDMLICVKDKHVSKYIKENFFLNLKIIKNARILDEAEVEFVKECKL